MNGEEYEEMPKSYLVNPATWTETSLLSSEADLSMDQFPALYGSWICLPVLESDMFNGVYTNCMRFLPTEAYSTVEDYRFKDSIVAMTYLTSRSAESVESST